MYLVLLPEHTTASPTFVSIVLRTRAAAAAAARSSGSSAAAEVPRE